jgi:hypothetical protein
MSSKINPIQRLAHITPDYPISMFLALIATSLVININICPNIIFIILISQSEM